VAKTNLDIMRGFEFGTFLFPRPKTEKVFFVDIHLERCLDSRKGKREKTATKLRTIPSNQRTSHFGLVVRLFVVKRVKLFYSSIYLA